MPSSPAIKVVVLGSQKSGKTSLINSLHNPDYEFNSDYKPTIASDFCTIEKDGSSKKNGINIRLWDTAGNLNYRSLGNSYLKGAMLGVYCVDLSNEAQLDNVARIKNDIEEFYCEARVKSNIEELDNDLPMIPIVLVGTCGDNKKTLSAEKVRVVEEKFNNLFNELSKNYTIKGPYETSAKTNAGINALRSDMFILAKESVKNITGNLGSSSRELHKNYSTQPFLNTPVSMTQILNKFTGDPLLKEKLEKLHVVMKALPSKKYHEIAKATDTFVSDLQSNLVGDKNKVINTFESTCYRCLAGKHPVLKAVAKAVAVVTIAAFVTVIAALVGFGIGFAAGAWTGPGAFISALAMGTGAAVAVVSTSGTMGIFAGGLGGYGLFKSSPVERAVHDIVTCAERPCGIEAK